MTTIEYIHELVKKVRASEFQEIHTYLIGDVRYTLGPIPYPDVHGVRHWELWIYDRDGGITSGSPVVGNDLLTLVENAKKYRDIDLEEIAPLAMWH